MKRCLISFYCLCGEVFSTPPVLPEKHPLLESDFVGELWYMYVSIIVGGQLVCVYMHV